VVDPPPANVAVSPQFANHYLSPFTLQLNESMTATRSGDYRLPSQPHQIVGNIALRLAPFVPRSLRERFIANRPGFYQVTDAGMLATETQGLSNKKWEAMQMPTDMSGKSVLDIGCSEGYFAQQCARLGAHPVLGVDSSLGRLLTASFQSRTAGLSVRYRMGLFPGPQVRGTFDYVICLSLLHHSLRKKDLWKVLTEAAYADDLDTLRDRLKRLRSLTAASGACVLEMPYEYDEPDAERQVVDFNLFSHELSAAGFSRARCLGTWDYNQTHTRFKDRMIYVAEA